MAGVIASSQLLIRRAITLYALTETLPCLFYFVPAIAIGLKPFKRKDDEDLSFFTAVKKKGKGAKPQDEKKAALAETKRKLNHALDILQTFMLLSIDVPQTTAEIPTTIEKVRAAVRE